MFRDVAGCNDKRWHGFTFNPGLRRRVDYDRIRAFVDIGQEYDINVRYWEFGYYAAILEQGATEHLGHGRTQRTRKKRPSKRLRHRVGKAIRRTLAG